MDLNCILTNCFNSSHPMPPIPITRTEVEERVVLREDENREVNC